MWHGGTSLTMHLTNIIYHKKSSLKHNYYCCFFFKSVTGASFVVFNGALKASSGFLAKSSIVEGMSFFFKIALM